MVVTSGQQYNVEEKPIVILYTYVNRHGGTPNKTKQKQCSTCRYFQHTHSMSLVGMEKRGACLLVHGDLPRSTRSELH